MTMTQHRQLAIAPLPPLHRNPLVQSVARAALAATAAWLAAPPLTSLALSATTGTRVRVRRIAISSWRPELRNVSLHARDGSELARAGVITFGRPPSTASPASEETRGPGATARDVTFTVHFAGADLRGSNWTAVRPSSTPAVALAGEVALAVTLAGPPVRALRMTPFGHLTLPPVGGMSGGADLVRRLTRCSLRYDARALPEDVRPAARRIGREAVAADVEAARRGTAAAVNDLREAARKVDAVLDGLPDLQHYRQFARKSESLLGSLSRLLSTPQQSREREPEESSARRPEVQGYRLLDETPSS